MTGPDTPGPSPGPAEDPPTTGHDQVDLVLAGLDGIADEPLANHHDRLEAAHEALHRVLIDENNPDDTSRSPTTGRSGP